MTHMKYKDDRVAKNLGYFDNKIDVLEALNALSVMKAWGNFIENWYNEMLLVGRSNYPRIVLYVLDES